VLKDKKRSQAAAARAFGVPDSVRSSDLGVDVWQRRHGARELYRL
jgi:hypothetical protein